MELRTIKILLILIVATFQMDYLVTSAASPTPTPFPDSEGIDLTALPLGDVRLSSSPKVGWIWPCHIEPNAPGARIVGPWINTSQETYNLIAKEYVHGSVNWDQHQFTVTLQGDKRVITSNALPDHPTGVFPAAVADPAHKYDPAPGAITTKDYTIVLPANPALLDQPGCVPGAVGFLLSGGLLFNALDAPGRDAVAHEMQDSCGGHVNPGGYHYHSLSPCLKDDPGPDGHSGLVGYALDGFGIYGRYDVGGKLLTSTDLDACHGHTHEIDWDGKKVVMYHYHATWDFPYTIGCMRGSYSTSDMMTISGGPGGGHAGGPGQGPNNSQLPPPPH